MIVAGPTWNQHWVSVSCLLDVFGCELSVSQLYKYNLKQCSPKFRERIGGLFLMWKSMQCMHVKKSRVWTNHGILKKDIFMEKSWNFA